MRRSVSLDMLQPNFTASRMTTRSSYGSCRGALRIANACSVTPRTVYLWSEPENRQRQARREEPLHVDAQVNGARRHGVDQDLTHGQTAGAASWRSEATASPSPSSPTDRNQDVASASEGCRP